MSFLPIFAEVVLLLLLLLILAANRLLGTDILFTAYLVWFAVGTAALLVLAQSSLCADVYWPAYLAVYAVSFALAAGILWSAGARLVVTPAVVLFVVGYFIAGTRKPMEVNAEGFFAALLLVVGVTALWLSREAPSAFQQVELRGLALFWLCQFVPSFLYWWSPWRSGGWYELMGNAAGIVGALAVAWLAWSFAGVGPEPATHALPEIEAASAALSLSALHARRRS